MRGQRLNSNAFNLAGNSVSITHADYDYITNNTTYVITSTNLQI